MRAPRLRNAQVFKGSPGGIREIPGTQTMHVLFAGTVRPNRALSPDRFFPEPPESLFYPAAVE